MKTCSKCRQTKPTTEFYFNRRRGRPQAYCKACQKVYATQCRKESQTGEREQKIMASRWKNAIRMAKKFQMMLDDECMIFNGQGKKIGEVIISNESITIIRDDSNRLKDCTIYKHGNEIRKLTRHKYMALFHRWRYIQQRNLKMAIHWKSKPVVI